MKTWIKIVSVKTAKNLIIYIFFALQSSTKPQTVFAFPLSEKV